MDRGRVIVRGALGYCPQDALLYPYLTPDEHLELYGTAYRLPPDELRARVEELFDRFAFGQHRGRIVQELSGGTRQKLNLAIALLHDPPLLLLDEPYAGFDIESYRRFFAYLDEAKRRGKCVILVTHLIFERERYDAILHLRDGAIHAERP